MFPSPTKLRDDELPPLGEVLRWPLAIVVVNLVCALAAALWWGGSTDSAVRDLERRLLQAEQRIDRLEGRARSEAPP